MKKQLVQMVWNVAAIAVAALSVMVCGQSDGERQRLSKEEHLRRLREDSLALKVAVLPTTDCLPLFVAKECRLFDTLGVDVRLRLERSQMDCDALFMKGAVEGIVTDLVRCEWMKTQGMPLRYVSSTNLSWQLIANPSARVKQLKQLGDKMVAITRHSATDLLTWHVLEGVKTTAPVFRIQINDLELRLQMLQNGELDAFWLPEPFATKARMEKCPVIVGSEERKMRLGVIAFNEKSLADKRRQQQLDLFLKAYNAACDSLNERGVEAYEPLLEKYCKADAQVTAALPKQKFQHATPPLANDVEVAKDFVERFPGGYTINN